MRNPLIEVNPLSWNKGYEAKSLQVTDYSKKAHETQTQVYNHIRRLTRSSAKTLSKDCSDEKILEIYQSSYRKLFSNQPLDDDDFILTGHELFEYPTIANDAKTRYLIYRYKYNKYPETKTCEPYPPCLQIEPTSICNFRCIMCYQIDPSFHTKSHGFMGNMTLDLFKKIIDQAAGNIEAITLASRGEPLLHRKLSEMLEYCEGKFLGLKLNTNASLLDENTAHTLLSSDINTLVFSIDAADRDSYENIRVNGVFEKVRENLSRFARIRETQYRDSNMVCKISGVRLNSSQSPEEIHDTWGSFVDSIALVNYVPWEDLYNSDQNQLIEPCSDLWRRMFIWWDGTVNPCDIDYKSTLSSWNIAESSISEIWLSDQYAELRRLHLSEKRGVLEPCARCLST